MIALQLDVSLTQGDFSLVLEDEGHVQVLALFGPSGGGKTTLLESVVGFRRPDRGEIRVGDRVLFSSTAGIDVPTRHRRVGYVPQDALLFPHLSVRGNLLYGARARETNGSDGVAPSFDLCVDMLEIRALLDRRVRHLSGGERQRVAIGRALMTAPALLLLDEPLAGVDRARRERIVPYLLRIREELHVPLVYVTHDIAEVRQIADRVLVIDGGRILRAGPPQQVLS